MTGARMGNVGWGWDDVRPYFERSERRVDAAGHASGEGPLDVKDVTPSCIRCGSNWLDAAAELGLPVPMISTGRIRKASAAIR